MIKIIDIDEIAAQRCDIATGDVSAPFGPGMGARPALG
jgi:hypothetical protein